MPLHHENIIARRGCLPFFFFFLTPIPLWSFYENRQARTTNRRIEIDIVSTGPKDLKEEKFGFCFVFIFYFFLNPFSLFKGESLGKRKKNKVVSRTYASMMEWFP